MKERSVLVIGAGVGGTVAARELKRLLGRSVTVTEVEKEESRPFQPSLLWVASGARTRAQVTRQTRRIDRAGVEVVIAEATRIDPEARKVTAGGREYSADYLVLAPGAALVPEQVPGLAPAGCNLYTLDGAEQANQMVESITTGVAVVLVARTPFKCPAAPYEAAMLLHDRIRRRGLGGKVSVSLYSPEPGPMAVTGPENSAKVRAMVEAAGVKYFPQHRVESVDPVAKRIKFENGTEAAFDALAYVPPHAAPPVVRNAGLTEPGGWVSVDRSTMETRFQGVFAIGDVTVIPLKMGLPLPKAGTFAQHQAMAVAAVIAARMGGRGESARYNGYGECFIETGRGRAGMGRGDFFAEPAPSVRLMQPSRRWHWGKVLFEKWWLWRRF